MIELWRPSHVVVSRLCQAGVTHASANQTTTVFLTKIAVTDERIVGMIGLPYISYGISAVKALSLPSQWSQSAEK